MPCLMIQECPLLLSTTPCTAVSPLPVRTTGSPAGTDAGSTPVSRGARAVEEVDGDAVGCGLSDCQALPDDVDAQIRDAPSLPFTA